MKSAFALVVLAILLRNSWQISTPQDDSYIAAVLEYEVTSNVTLNIENYEEHIQNAAQQNADIVVFPEMTLTVSTRAVEVPINGLLKTYPIPALNVSLYDEILVHISAAARQNRVYVVVNLQEILNCSNVDTQTFENCPEDKTYLFNTNVVFDRNGAVIDRYRKINLFGEFTRTPALEPDIGIFTTDFGVTFGHFICFDLMFQIPAVQIVEKYNLTDVIFTTMWFSEMPYLTAVQIQEAYAYSMNINFIASGANNVRVGSAGSGIYSGKAGALVSIMPGVPTTRLLVSKVPKIPGQVNFEFPGPIYDNPADHDGLVLIGDPSIPSHISRELVQGFQEFTLVDKEVSCKFTVRLQHGSGDVKYKYRAFVHDGSNTYSNRQLGVAVCSLVACKTDDVKSCPYRFTNAKNHIGFEELQIEMTTYRTQYNTSLKCDNIVYFPQSLTINKFPLDPRNFTYEHITRKKEVTGRTHVIFKINKPQDSVLSFSIWGRLYTKDVNQLKTITNVDVNNYIDLENDIYGIDKRSRRL